MLPVALLFFCSMSAGEIKQAPSAQTGALQKPQQLSRQKQFFLPNALYAVPGVEMNLYFRNIFLTVNHGNYVFDVTCEVGANYGKRWSFMPTAQNAGKEYPLSIKVYDQDGLAAEGSTVVHVAQTGAGKGKDISILMVGDSLTDHAVYPARLLELCRQEGNPNLKMVGSHCGGGKAVQPGGVAHEGYGGWGWGSFLHLYQDPAKAKDPAAGYRVRSKFLVSENGKTAFSLAAYLKKYNDGKIPDVITFQLGVNDVFALTDENRQAGIEKILKNADELIAAFRKEAPEAWIGVGYVTPGSGQDSFGTNYKNGQTAWGYCKNQFQMNIAMAAHFAKYHDPKLIMIPTCVNLDCENNFPVRRSKINEENSEYEIRQVNGVHPAASGYRQVGDTFYSWLKYLLSTKIK